VITTSWSRTYPEVEKFLELLAGCQRSVFVYAMSLLHDANDAEEVLQETNLVLWRKYDQYKPGTDFNAWACRIAHFEVMRIRQRRNREERLLSDNLLEMLATEYGRSTDVIEERRAALSRCLEKLRVEDRELVLQRYQPEGSTRRVAEALGRSVQGTRKSLRRIRRTLEKCVQRRVATEVQP